MSLLTCLGAGGLIGGGTAPFNPADYGNAVLWYDCSDNAYCLDSGNAPADPDEAVQTLTDRTGNTYDGVQATGARQGIWKSNIQNSLGALLVDQSNSNWYSVSGGADITNNISGLTLVWVYSAEDISQFYCTLCNFTENSSWDPRVRVRLIYNNTTIYNVSFTGVRQDADSEATITSAGTFNVSTWYVLTVVIDYANALASIYVNSAAAVSPTAFQTAGSTDSTDSQIDATFCIQDPGLNFAFDGYIGEYIVYNEALGNTDRGNLITALGDKWGITV